MEGFSNWDREEPFEPFTVMLFKGLQVVAFLFFLAYLAMNLEAKQGNITSKAEMLVTVSWPDNHPDDIDTYVEDPQGNIVWYHVMEAGLMNLERDDRGDYKNMIVVNGKTIRNPIRQEIVTMRADHGRVCRQHQPLSRHDTDRCLSASKSKSIPRSGGVL
jgi:hypothetical protein